MYQWIIIGGGIQGSCIAARLLKEKKVSKDHLLVIDVHERPLQRWARTTDKIGMDYLRSPLVHHLAVNPFSLKRYASEKGYASSFRGEYKRPRLDMFNQHSLDLLEEAGVTVCWQQGKVSSLSKIAEGWSIEAADGQEYLSEKVVIAIGVNDIPYYPGWAQTYKNYENVKHIFEIDATLPEKGDVIIVGGGMTAGHLAVTLSKNENIKSVKLVKRHPFRIHKFDSDPGWLGPKYMMEYHKTMSYEKRRNMIKKARHKGSITKDLYSKIHKQERHGSLKIVTEHIEEMSTKSGRIQLTLESENILNGTSIILATGADAEFPGKSWINPLIQEMNLPCAPCGFPIVSKSLEWKRGLYVGGALAELEIGPIARNIAGARKASERIVKFA